MAVAGGMALGCSSSTTSDPCHEVTCSGHGTCVSPDGVATCECDDGYEAQGSACVVDLTGPVDCPDIGLDPSVGSILYVCDCGAGASVDCQPGDDANPGTSPDAPWQTFEKARSEFGAIEPGDSIVLCRGGAFPIGDGSRWVNDRCLAANPCVVRDYTPDWAAQDAPRPIILGSGDQSVFALEDGGDADHEEGYTIMNLDLRGDGEGTGFFFYNDIDDVLMCNVSVDGFSIAVNVQKSNAPAEGSDGLNMRIVLRNSSITNNHGQGWLGGCEGCAIEYSTFVNNGFGLAVFNHNIYAGGPRDVRIVGNDLYQSALIDGQCQGVSLVVHGVVDGLLIEGNTIREDPGAAGQGCWGIAVDTGYSSAEEFRNVVIRNNTVINVGNLGIGLNACQDCLIENNVVIMDQGFGGTAIAAPNRERDDSDLPMTRMTVRNNSIFIGSQSGGTGIRLGGEGTAHVLASNAIYYSGSGSFSCFELDLDVSAYDAVDHNLCYSPNSGDAQWVDGVGDLNAWQTSSSFDLTSLVSDPGFTSITGPGYDLSAASAPSPLVDNGHPTQSSPEDLEGLPRDASPDIGAYEH